MSSAARQCPHCGQGFARAKMSRAKVCTRALLVAAAIFVAWAWAVEKNHEEFRKQERQDRVDMEAIRDGSYRAPVPVRLVK